MARSDPPQVKRKFAYIVSVECDDDDFSESRVDERLRAAIRALGSGGTATFDLKRQTTAPRLRPLDATEVHP
jgi:hypothetical protein